MNSFRQDSIDFLNGKHVNMGSWQYEDHEGTTSDGESRSGHRQWTEAEHKRCAESDDDEANMANVERATARIVAKDIEVERLLPKGLHAVELGPGTPSAFANKTVTILKAFDAASCTIVDKSQRFLDDICANNKFANLNIKPILSDFFRSDDCYFVKNEDAILIMFGTISNIDAPIIGHPPKYQLVETIKNIANKIKRGWLLLSFDSNHDGETIKLYYQKHHKFQLNIFYRMQADGQTEGWLDGRFDPSAFSYEPEWYRHSGQLAHMAIASRDMTFSLNGEDITFKEGQRLHIKNSFKFAPEFFGACCKLAGLEVVRAWLNTSVKFYLLGKL